MPRDPEGTKRRVREAAVEAFAEHGPDGTTMEAIAARAGVNKERVYAYFGDKTKLFSAVVGEELARVSAAVPLRIEHLEDIGRFIGENFDYLTRHPHLGRLMLWEGLADSGESADETERRRIYDEKRAAVRDAQRAGIIDPELDPGRLILLLLGLASWWSAVPQTARMLTDHSNDEPGERAARRAAAVEAGLRLAAPRGARDQMPGRGISGPGR